MTNLSVGMGISGQARLGDHGRLRDVGQRARARQTAPTSAIGCNGGSDGDGCAAKRLLQRPGRDRPGAADDPGGSGIARIVYTVDGSTPTASNGATYQGPFSVAQTTTVKFRAIDKAGNLEPR